MSRYEHVRVVIKFCLQEQNNCAVLCTLIHLRDYDVGHKKRRRIANVKPVIAAMFCAKLNVMDIKPYGKHKVK